ncbi:hypothetical protein llap_16429 [Limosa lapponica baueri]|uniref:Uncharacterized protein n=1 Tax=Limosa lapponica baueri TaxID=1758121 RepID=A0A2I0THH7_LIMLA|nr:hypothetical protein llap_16429 [Limosa lapponica baueri]
MLRQHRLWTFVEKSSSEKTYLNLFIEKDNADAAIDKMDLITASKLVYKVKANTILEKLASASVGSYGHDVWLDLVNEAKENLQKIQDSQFVVDYCLNAPWPLYETTHEMLNYAKVRILKKEYKTIAPSSDEAPLSITEVDFESSFDEKMLENLLNAIHFTVPLRELCLWLKDVVIPFLRRVVPKGQKILAKWLEQGARNLELTDKANWPENGLQMAEVFFTSKNQGEMGLTTFGQWTPLRCSDCEEVHRLKKLVNDLQELINLYRKYNCRLALCDFEKENATTIVFRMFDKILAPELVPSILEKFIKPYLCKHNLQKDELLLQYIKDLLERCRTRSTSVFETAWEAKAIAVIGCISDTDHKTQMFMTKTLVEVLKFLFSIQKDNPLKKDECEANLKMFETLAALQTTSFGEDRDPYEEWTYDDFFNEDGIVLDPQIALPVAYETTSSLLPVCGKLAFLNIESIYKLYFILIFI